MDFSFLSKVKKYLKIDKNFKIDSDVCVSNLSLKNFEIKNLDNLKLSIDTFRKLKKSVDFIKNDIIENLGELKNNDNYNEMHLLTNQVRNLLEHSSPKIYRALSEFKILSLPDHQNIQKFFFLVSIIVQTT